MALTQVNGGMLDSVAQQVGFRNRIINGQMQIDQRNAGASVTVSANDSSTFINDRWQVIKNSSATISAQQTTTAPSGFSNSLCVTVSAGSAVGATNYLIFGQRIEGFNFSDLSWGTAAASNITISFQVRSSLTGTFSVVFVNSENSRCYGANYTISSANTWEAKTITIAGDTTGTWVGATNGIGLSMYFSLGAGSSYQGTAGSWQAMSNLLNTSTAQNTFLTSANTFYITGVQLEKGSTATSFDYRPYGTELALCQRYFQLIRAASGTPNSSSVCVFCIQPSGEMRAAPTAGQTGVMYVSDYINDTAQSSTGTLVYSSFVNQLTLGLQNYSGLVPTRPMFLRGNNSNAITLSAEL